MNLTAVTITLGSALILAGVGVHLYKWSAQRRNPEDMKSFATEMTLNPPAFRTLTEFKDKVDPVLVRESQSHPDYLPAELFTGDLTWFAKFATPPSVGLRQLLTVLVGYTKMLMMVRGGDAIVLNIETFPELIRRATDSGMLDDVDINLPGYPRGPAFPIRRAMDKANADYGPLIDADYPDNPAAGMDRLLGTASELASAWRYLLAHLHRPGEAVAAG